MPRCNACGAIVSMKKRDSHRATHERPPSLLASLPNTKPKKPHLCAHCQINTKAPNHPLCHFCIAEMEDPD